MVALRNADIADSARNGSAKIAGKGRRRDGDFGLSIFYPFSAFPRGLGVAGVFDVDGDGGDGVSSDGILLEAALRKRFMIALPIPSSGTGST